MTHKPLVDNNYLLLKFPGKGGWTYTPIPEVLQDKHAPFGWVRVRGSIDGYELKAYKLMPMGNGQLFLPVKAAIRKAIKKEAGDTVRVVLYRDHFATDIPSEIMDCFRMEPPKAWEVFQSFGDSDKQNYLNWIYDAKTEETKAKRIAKMMDRLAQGKKFFEPS